MVLKVRIVFIFREEDEVGTGRVWLLMIVCFLFCFLIYLNC